MLAIAYHSGMSPPEQQQQPLPPPSPLSYLTTRDVAALLRVSEGTVQRWVRKGELQPSLSLGGKAGYRFVQSDVDRFLHRHRGESSKP